MQGIGERTIDKLTWRFVPFLIVCYLFAYLDRVNLAFAASDMSRDLGFSAATIGTGAGLFFLSYFLLEVPSNLALERFGARRWIARIMVSWGVLAGAMAFVGTVQHFYVMRLLLGAAEAGFFPGVIYFLTVWFPAEFRGRIIGWFMVAVPVSTVVGAPMSGYLLGLEGAMGLRGWQWLFLVEAAPPVLLAVVASRYLTDQPRDAAWLTAEERAWLEERLTREEAERRAMPRSSLARALCDPRVLGLGLVYFGIVLTLYGLGFFLPTIVRGFGLTSQQTGWVSAIPYLVGAAVMVPWGLRSDLAGERRWHAAWPCFVAGLGLALAATTLDPVLKMAALSMSAAGTFAAFPVFWTMPAARLTGAAAAGGIALVNSIGNLGGYFGPAIMGHLKDVTGTFESGLYVLAVGAVVAGSMVLLLGTGSVSDGGGV
jgi:MFS family permease